jgi:hypothetical protein
LFAETCAEPATTSGAGAAVKFNSPERLPLMQISIKSSGVDEAVEVRSIPGKRKGRYLLISNRVVKREGILGKLIR